MNSFKNNLYDIPFKSDDKNFGNNPIKNGIIKHNVSKYFQKIPKIKEVLNHLDLILIENWKNTYLVRFFKNYIKRN